MGLAAGLDASFVSVVPLWACPTAALSSCLLQREAMFLILLSLMY